MSTVATYASPPRTREPSLAEGVLASRRDTAVAYLLSMATAACGLLAFRLANTRFEEIEFAEYAVTRRTLGFLVPLLSLGVGVALPRRVATERACGIDRNDAPLTAGSALVAALSVLGFATALIVTPRPVALACTGFADRADLAWAMLPLAGGLVLAGYAAAYWRGRMQCGASHGIQLVSIGIIPNIALLATQDVRTFLLLTGSAVGLLGGAALVAIQRSADVGRHVSARGALQTACGLLREGAPRTPGDLAFYGLLAAPAIVAAQRAGFAAGGELAYALAVLMLIQQLVAPLGALLLPEAAYLLHAGRAQQLERRLVRLLAASLAVTSALTLVGLMWTEPLVRIHLGSCSPSLTAIVRGVLLAAPPLRLFMCVRNIVDAGEARAICPMLCVSALGVFGLIVLLAPASASPVVTVIIAFLTAVIALALAAAWRALVVLRRRQPALVPSATT